MWSEESPGTVLFEKEMGVKTVYRSRTGNLKSDVVEESLRTGLVGWFLNTWTKREIYISFYISR